MKIIVLGASGLVGRAVTAALAPRHELVPVSRRSDPKADLTDPASLDELFENTTADAVVCCAANVPLRPLADLTEDQVLQDLHGKLLGQVALTRRAAARLADGGSITLTGGTFTEPFPGSSLGALVNAGLAGFVRSAATDLPRGLRINAVSPGWISETLEAMGEDGSRGTPVARVAAAYTELVEGTAQGTTVVPE
ncbi:short chain dehydrogenase [Amycolatopsis saalfeldensis]|uniref:NAD(P)-dependent dehydrogenase, short-chain alcohol dehydrogenase family n=1 Tax=Amycolatopsis saalfeldensis TaxID=394193 RepID=A0A1H8QGJ1_9PSEU|nr:short chain dehydrogenase [Amycolatopsis saalfeldensis]SEO53345.1 NAD(P)-dependent dehydrogenase, short-chain alcohol dehydrogenase family [Amycolatopsis saalfeldensis]